MKLSCDVIKKIGIVLSCVIVGGLVYEVATSNIALAYNKHVESDLRADNQRIIRLIDKSEKRVADLQVSLEGIRSESNTVTSELERSKGIAKQLGEENTKLRTELGRSREVAAGLRDENTRLGAALEQSLGDAGSITETNRLIGESIDRAIDIVRKYESGIGGNH